MLHFDTEHNFVDAHVSIDSMTCFFLTRPNQSLPPQANRKIRPGEVIEEKKVICTTQRTRVRIPPWARKSLFGRWNDINNINLIILIRFFYSGIVHQKRNAMQPFLSYLSISLYFILLYEKKSAFRKNGLDAIVLWF